MKMILFTKILRETPAKRFGELASRLGIDGYNLCVRDGYEINPGNAATAVARACRNPSGSAA